MQLALEGLFTNLNTFQPFGQCVSSDDIKTDSKGHGELESANHGEPTETQRLVIALHDLEEVSERYHAAEALAVLGPDAATAIPALRKVARHDSSVLVRKSAVLALGEIGVAVAGVVPDLQHIAHYDEDKFVRQRAEQALRLLGSNAIGKIVLLL